MAASSHIAKQTPPPAPLGILRGHGVPVNATCFLAPTTIVSGAADGAVKIWDLKSRRESATLSTAHSKAGVLHASALADAAQFVTQGRDGFVKVWDAATFAEGCHPLASYYCGSFSFTKFATLRWPKVAASADGVATDSGSLIVCPSAEADQVRCCCLSVCAVCCALLTCMWEGMLQILIYDTRAPTSRPALHIAVPDGAKKKGMCMSLCLFESNGGGGGGLEQGRSRQAYIAAGYESGALSILDLRSGGKLACEAQVTESANPRTLDLFLRVSARFASLTAGWSCAIMDAWCLPCSVSVRCHARRRVSDLWLLGGRPLHGDVRCEYVHDLV